MVEEITACTLITAVRRMGHTIRLMGQIMI